MRFAIVLMIGLSACETGGAFSDHARFPEEHGSHEHAHDDDVSIEATDPALREAGSRVQVLESQTVDQPTEVIGLIDVHEESGHHQEALERLRIKGASLGADAVL